MMKGKVLLLVLICIVILSGCNSQKTESIEPEASTSIPIASDVSDNLPDDDMPEPEEDTIPIFLPDLTTEEGIEEYLLGEWFCDVSPIGRAIANMTIDEDLNVHISFYDPFEDKPKGDYKGKIKLDRIYANSNEPPDIICIQLMDEDFPKGDFFFLHRTVYDKKCVMSLFFADGKSVFNRLANIDAYENFEEYVIEELMFEKAAEESSQILPRKDDWFYAVFWGHGAYYESIWIDDVWWTPQEEDDFATVYPRAMTLYESDIPESVLYKIAPDMEFDILGDGMEKGEVYYIETDEHGNITELINAEYKEYLENNTSEQYKNLIENDSYENVSQETQDLIFEIIMTDIVEIEEYLDSGMTILFTGETTIIDGEECYDLVLGTNHEEAFVREIYYTVNIYTENVFRYDVIMDTWEIVALM